ncbi:MAG: hypothetical protein VYE73_17310 [Acidobacteriota bacterium]|nr:hypothetical protein [Acidobacteriota bacterium]
MGAALSLLESATERGTIVDLERSWDRDPGWRTSPLSAGTASDDGRAPRSLVPVYQTDEDRQLAESTHGPGRVCETCVGAELEPVAH